MVKLKDTPELRKLRFVSSSYKDLLSTPDAVRKMTGFVLDRVQRGQYHSSIKPLKGKDLSGVYEIRVDESGDTYRTLYVVNLGEHIYVLDVFQKKSKRGGEVPKHDMERLHARLKLAKELAKDEEKNAN
jgi:phage-related protein